MRWWVIERIETGQHVELISWIFWVLLSITLHELAHGWAAIWEGDRTPIEHRRMTGNPAVHMGPQSLLMFALCGIAWGMMPVSPHRFRHRRYGDLIVSAAGPAMNLAIAAVCVVASVVWLLVADPASVIGPNLARFLFTGAWLNLLLAAFNLLPFPPLDGSRIAAAVVPALGRRFDHPNAAIFGLAFFVLVFFLTPAGAYVIGVIQLGAAIVIEVPATLTGGASLIDLLA